MIKGFIEKHTVNWLFRKSIEKELDFTISIQRREVWDIEHKSNFIASLLIGIPVESLLYEEDGDGYLVLDGKQRSLTIIQFLKDEFEISSKCKVSEVSGEEIIGKKFSELSENLQETLKEYELSIAVLRPLSEAERELVFFMRNQAVPLVNMELVRVLMGREVLKDVEKLAGHGFMSKVNLSSSKTNRYQDQQVLLECMVLETESDYSFSSKDLKAFVAALREVGVSSKVKDSITNTFDYMNRAIPEKMRPLRKLHVPMVYVVAKQAVADNVPEETFRAWLEQVFEDIKGDDNKYIDAYEAGTAKKSSINARIKFMTEHFNDYIEKAM